MMIITLAPFGYKGFFKYGRVMLIENRLETTLAVSFVVLVRLPKD